MLCLLGGRGRSRQCCVYYRGEEGPQNAVCKGERKVHTMLCLWRREEGPHNAVFIRGERKVQTMLCL